MNGCHCQCRTVVKVFDARSQTTRASFVHLCFVVRRALLQLISLQCEDPDVAIHVLKRLGSSVRVVQQQHCIATSQSPHIRCYKWFCRCSQCLALSYTVKPTAVDGTTLM